MGGVGRRHVRGQATTETMIMMMFLLLMIFGLVHMTMLVATKYVVNYAAYVAARTEMVRGDGFTGKTIAWTAAYMVLSDNAHWWSSPLKNSPDIPLGSDVSMYGREGLTVTYHVPFGLPIFNSIDSGGVKIVGFSPVAVQPEIEEKGDNAKQ